MAPNKQQSKPRSSADIIQEIEALNEEHSMCEDFTELQIQIQSLATAITFIECHFDTHEDIHNCEWFERIISPLDKLHSQLSLALAEKFKPHEECRAKLNTLRHELIKARRAESSDSDD